MIAGYRKRAESAGELKDFDASPTILFVEDEVLLRMAVSDELRNVGYRVIDVADAEQALDVLAHNSGVRLVVSDIQLPGALDGLELARLAHAYHPPIKVVLTSGRFGDAGGVAHDGFFHKPYDASQLINHIAALLDQEPDV